LDCGLTKEQSAWCRSQGATLVTPKWDFDFPGREELHSGLKSLTARPFLPEYFTNYDIYMWIDADCWVQQEDAVELFISAAATGALAVAPEIHRSMRHYKHAWNEFSEVCGGAYRTCFGNEIAERLVRYPMINAGVFALANSAPHWKGWKEIYNEALQHSIYLADQLSLNVLVYDKNYPHEPLPSRCNWPVHHAIPAWSLAKNLFTEPAMPYEPLGILHLTIYTKTLESMDVLEVEGATPPRSKPRSLRWPGKAK
jgi:lipopolysaccharide biosynthesis glycosyltransferase